MASAGPHVRGMCGGRGRGGVRGEGWSGVRVVRVACWMNEGA